MPDYFKVIKFGLVGCSGLLIDFSATYYLKEKADINKYLANAMGFICAVLSNFFFNKYWTFNSAGNQKTSIQFLFFLLISIVGLCINTGIIIILVKKLHARFYFSKLIAVFVVFLWNFLMNNYFTFS